MLTIKQGQLLAQLEAFDQECDNMREQLEAAKDTSNNTNFELSDVVKQKDVLNNENARLQVCTDKNQNKKHLFRNQTFQTLNLLSHIKYFLHA